MREAVCGTVSGADTAANPDGKSAAEPDRDPIAREAWTSTHRGRRVAMLRLSYLAPSIVGLILKGRQPAELTAKRLVALSQTLPLAWAELERHLGIC